MVRISRKTLIIVMFFVVMNSIGYDRINEISTSKIKNNRAIRKN
jgi:hypothetical protein